MRTRFLLIILFVFSSVLLYAQNGSVAGIIVSEKNNLPLLNVGIAAGMNNGTYSDKHGRFFIDELENGYYDLLFKSLGYEDLTITIRITSEEKQLDLGAIVLKQKPYQIIDVNIIHTPNIFDENYTGSNLIIRKQDLIQVQPLGTEEILKQVPGVNISGDMGISNRLNAGIRGSYPRRSDKLLILEDGTPVAPAVYLAPSAYYNPPPERLDGIEVIKGAEMLGLGPHSIFGAINYITHLPPSSPTINVNITGGTRNYHSQSISYGGTWKNIGAEVQVLNKSFDGFQNNTEMQIFNTTAKLFADLGKSQSVYAKFNFHKEKSKATYSGLTPFTFELDPTQNPFDADDLNTSRVAIDLVHQASFTKKFILNSKIYLSSFRRDWWRQKTKVILAKDIASYVGKSIFNDRYSYMNNVAFGDEDYVRVGKVDNGFESTVARNRQFKIMGLQEKIHYHWNYKKLISDLEFILTNHMERFDNEQIANDSARFSRTGIRVKNEKYILNASSAFVKNKIQYNRITFTPMMRYEVVRMRRDQLALLQQKPNDPPDEPIITHNSYSSFQPGLEIAFQLIQKDKHKVGFYTSIHNGYSPPTSNFAFFSVDDGQVNKTSGSDTVNMEPEISSNSEIGLRGFLADNLIQSQFTYFNKNINNFYAAGRKEAFESLGSVQINGMELGVIIDVSKIIPIGDHSLKLSSFATLMNSHILSGTIVDSDLFKAKHSKKSLAELINKVNSQRNAFKVYFENDSLITRNITSDDLDYIKEIEMNFGEGMLENSLVPYVPDEILNLALHYHYKGIYAGAQYNYTGTQYTSYLNFENETSDGAIGILKSFQSLDLNTSYTIKIDNEKSTQEIKFFLSVKNVTNEIYRSSRLHRVSSGIMPAGFRQFNAGLFFKF